jgi:hypothetical protein
MSASSVHENEVAQDDKGANSTKWLVGRQSMPLDKLLAVGSTPITIDQALQIMEYAAVKCHGI